MNQSRQNLSDFDAVHCLNGIPQSETMVPYPSIRSLLDSQVLRYGNKPFLISYSKDKNRFEYSFDEIYKLASKTANLLKSQNCKFGDRIAIDTTNSIETIVLYLASWLIGATTVVINSTRSPKDLKVMLEESRTNIVLVKSEHKVQNISQDLSFPITILEVTPDFIELSINNQNEEFIIGQKSKLRSDGMIYYKLENNRPKGVILSHYNLMVNGMGTADWLDISDDSPIYCGVELDDTQGIVVSLMASLCSGAPLIISEQFDPNDVLHRIKKENAQLAIIDSRNLELIINSNSVNFHAPHFKHFVCGQPISVDIIKTANEKLNCNVITGFCLPETSGFSTLIPSDLPKSVHNKWMRNIDFTPIGKPLHPNEMDIQNAEGISLPEGETGEIVIRGHNVMKGYLNDDGATQIAFKNGWLKTGYKGFYLIQKNSDRYFFISPLNEHTQ